MASWSLSSLLGVEGRKTTKVATYVLMGLVFFLVPPPSSRVSGGSRISSEKALPAESFEPERLDISAFRTFRQPLLLCASRALLSSVVATERPRAAAMRVL